MQRRGVNSGVESIHNIECLTRTHKIKPPMTLHAKFQLSFVRDGASYGIL